ncbi:MAG: alpha/beta hydrolase [Actinomycetia bacterium]|nr:alpha/beta hydrolase [Actinomycetes bacterium]
MDQAATQLVTGLAAVMHPVESRTVVEVRADSAAIAAGMTPSVATARREDRIAEVDGRAIRVRLYRSDTGTGPAPVLVFAHGGGWVLGDLNSYDSFCDRLTNESGWTLLSVDYRCSPETQFPGPVEDVTAALVWLEAHAEELDVDPMRIAIGGDSSGGNLAAAVALLARDRDLVPLVGQLLLYPVVHCSSTSDAYDESRDTVLLTAAAMAWFCRHYVSADLDADHPYASPLLAPDLSGLPPTVVVTAEVDPLFPGIVAYVDRLREADVPTEHLHYDGVFHGFVSFAGAHAVADAAFAAIVDALRSFRTPHSISEGESR